MPYAKKSLGQHFLRSESALRKIAEAGQLSPADIVLEIGPGEGVLTKLLLEQAGKVIAVEKDDRLIPLLKQKFATEIASRKLELIHADILKFSIFNFQFSGKPYKIVANIPYYITGALIRKFLESDAQPKTMVLLIQKEVGKRIIAKDKKESILSISVKAYGVPRYIDTVKAGAFSPPPKVDSAIIAIENISKEFFTDGLTEPLHGTRLDLVRKAELRFFALLKKGFAHPRKLLSSNLEIDPQILVSCGLSPKVRAEEVSLAEWRCLVSMDRSRS